MYDVTGVNVFPRKLMEFSRKKPPQNIPPPLLWDKKAENNFTAKIIYLHSTNISELDYPNFYLYV